VGRKKTPARELVDVVFQDYRIRWSKLYGPMLGRFNGRDRTDVRNAIDVLGLREVRRRLRSYFVERNEWTKRNRHPIRVFLNQIDRYGGSVSNGEKEEWREPNIASGEDFDVDEEIRRRGKGRKGARRDAGGKRTRKGR